MDIGTVIGLVLAIGAIFLGIILGGGSVGAMFDITSLMVVIFGTLGATIISFPLAQVLKLHGPILKSFLNKPADIPSTIKDLVRYAEVARREGILSLENVISEMNDPFIVRGIKMAVDGTDPELIRTIMETELESSMDRHAAAKQILDTIGKFAPAYGMIGTLMGLIFMLRNMDDPSTIGGGMAVALITTLYGALVANVVTGPLAEKLGACDAEEVLAKTVIIAGVMAIQSGDNPRVVENKLLTYLPPAKRAEVSSEAA